ncbi:MAG: iron-sulfur cluster assembly accessory protein [Bacteroidota bacterium]|nr:iron-sulfur cluster assembly accessory protein [Bacteroidota bacterium]
MNLPFTISDIACDEIKKMMQIKGIDASFSLRLGIKGSGCSGSGYLIGFDTKSGNDKQYDYNGIKIIIDKKQILYIAGVKIDFIEENNQRGFVFSI